MHNQKLPEPLNYLLIVIAIVACVVCGWQIRQGGGAAWCVTLGLAGYFFTPEIYQLWFRR